MARSPASTPATAGQHRDAPFLIGLWLLAGFYLALIVAMLAADFTYTTPGHILKALNNPEIQYSIKLSLLSCSMTMVLAMWVAVPAGYLLSRYTFPGKTLVNALLDIPIVLPPLVIGLSLLILFQTAPGRWLQQWLPITYEVPAVILSQFMVACAFAVRTMHATFNEISPRTEHVALTLGCTRAQVFFRVVLPEAKDGMLTAATLAWARAMGEFGPILIFAGATRMRTEVLPTTVFLELSVGNLEAAVAVSLLMVAMALVVLVLVRMLGQPSVVQR